MKLIVNERDGCCESIHIEYTPIEALIINHAMRRYVCDDEVNEEDRTIMKQMLDVKPIFREIRAESLDQEPCTDVVSRRKITRYVRSMFKRGFGKKKCVEFILKYLEMMPAVGETNENEV